MEWLHCALLAEVLRGPNSNASPAGYDLWNVFWATLMQSYSFFFVQSVSHQWQSLFSLTFAGGSLIRDAQRLGSSSNTQNFPISSDTITSRRGAFGSARGPGRMSYQGREYLFVMLTVKKNIIFIIVPPPPFFKAWGLELFPPLASPKGRLSSGYQNLNSISIHPTTSALNLGLFGLIAMLVAANKFNFF